MEELKYFRLDYYYVKWRLYFYVMKRRDKVDGKFGGDLSWKCGFLDVLKCNYFEFRRFRVWMKLIMFLLGGRMWVLKFVFRESEKNIYNGGFNYLYLFCVRNF